MDVRLFESRAIGLVEATHGLQGCAIVLKLLCKLYGECGYYLPWDDEQALLFADKAGKNLTMDEVNEVVDILLAKSFFDLEMYQKHHVLTSLSIQQVWLDATRRRRNKGEKIPYLLVKEEPKTNPKTKPVSSNDEVENSQIFTVADADNEQVMKTNEKNVDNFRQSKVK
jgi:hypothetical protein